MQEIKCLKPQELVKELDKYIIGQTEAKKAVAVALRNRYRRKLIEKPLRDEIVPKNILMIGPTGVGKTEIARRIAKLTDAPFVKVEATNFTEVGYVGKDVDSIIKDLVDVSVKKERKKAKEENEVKAKEIAKNKIIDIMLEIIPDDSKEKEKEKKKMIELFDKGELFDKDIEIDIAEQPKSFIDQIDFPEGSAHIGMISIGEIVGKNFGEYKDLQENIDGLELYSYIELSEEILLSNKLLINVFKHEFLHSLGFFDAYKIDESINTIMQGVSPILQLTELDLKILDVFYRNPNIKLSDDEIWEKLSQEVLDNKDYQTKIANKTKIFFSKSNKI